MIIPQPYYTFLQPLFPELDLEGVKVSTNSWLARLAGRFRILAVTLGSTVYFTPRGAALAPRELAGLYAHELAHVRQQRRYGALAFLVLYGLGWLLSVVRLKSPRLSPLEDPCYKVQELALKLWDSSPPPEGLPH